MRKCKWDTETVRGLFAKEDYELPEDWEYVNNSTKIPYVCPKGHEHYIRWSSWKSGNRCPCPLCRRVNSETVRASFTKEGYVLPIDWEYVKAHTKIPFTCLNGHEHYIRWSSWSQGQRCIYCGTHAPINTKQVRESFSKEGYVISADWEYVNAHTKILYTCSNGHEHYIKWGNWQSGNRCMYCTRNLKNNMEQVRFRAAFTKEGYIIPEAWKYVNIKAKIPYECPRGHKNSTNGDKWNIGYRCPWCGKGKANLTRYNPNENLTLYWIKIYDWIHGKWCYKFGITIKNIKGRFIESMKEHRFRIKRMRQTTAIASQICMLEQSLLYNVKDYRAKWVPSYFDGNTECFECDEEEALRIWNNVVNGW